MYIKLKKIGFFFVFTLYCHIIIFAQQKEVHFAKQLIAKATNSKDVALAEINLSSAYLLVNTDSAYKYANKVLQYATQNNDISLRAEALLCLGEYYSYTNQQILFIDHLINAKALFEQMNNTISTGNCFFALGEMFATFESFGISRGYFYDALSQYKLAKDSFYIASAYASLGDVFYEEKIYDSALFFTNQALKIAQSINDSNTIDFCYRTLVDVYTDQNKLSVAGDYLAKSSEISIASGNIYNIAIGKIQMAKLLGAKSNFKDAIVLLDSSISLAKYLHMDELIIKALHTKYVLYKNAGLNNLALNSLEEKNLLREQLFGQKRFSVVNKLIENFTLEKRAKQIDLLKEKNKLNFVLITTLSIILFLVLLLLFNFFIRFKERKKLMLELSNQNILVEKNANTLKHLNTIKDRMFSIISHDLRGPVSSLKALVDYMKAESLSAEDSAMIVQELKQSVTGMDMLLENLLVWAQIQIRGGVTKTNEPCNIKSIIDDTVTICSIAAKQKKITILEAVEPDLIIDADKNYLALVIRNLLNNAIKFTPVGGSIAINANYDNGKAKICVIDTGIGLTEEEKNKLFNVEKPFSTLGTNEEKGSGLGLMFVKEYTQSVGADFSICSTKGVGSRFCISF